MQPCLRYSLTLARASSGVPEAVMRWIRSSGTRCLACLNLLFGGGPAQDGLDLRYHLLGYAGGLGDVRLLRQVLGQQPTGRIDGLVVIVVHRADDQLRAVEILEPAPGPARPFSSSSRALSLYSGGTQ